MNRAVEEATETPSEWIEKYFYVNDPRDIKTGEFLPAGPIILADHQRRIINEALSKNDDGLFKYNTIVYSAPKKSGKSALTSAVVLYMAMHNPNSFVACLANDGAQANDRLYGPIYTNFRLHKQLGGIFENINANLWEVTLPNFAKIRAVPCDAAGEAGSQPVMSAWSELWGFECFDKTTEILTKSGWKFYSELTDDDLYATRDHTGKFEWQKASSLFIADYAGPMYSVEQKRISMLVTPRHRIFHKSKTGHKTYLEHVEDACKRNMIFIPNHAEAFDGEYSSTFTIPATKRREAYEVSTDLFVEFMAWFLSEGSAGYKYDRKKPRVSSTVRIAQSIKANPENYARIKKNITELGWTPVDTYHSVEKCFTDILVYDSPLAHYLIQFGNSKHKFIPEWIKELPRHLLRKFLYIYMLGDGHVIHTKYKNCFGIYTASKRMTEDLLEIAVKAGYMARYLKVKKDGRYVGYKLHFSDPNRARSGIAVKKDCWKIIDYSGKVFCPTVPNGTVLVRRNNTIYWSGNSEKKRRLFTEMTIPSTLYGRAIRWIESYAGFTGVSTLLEQIYNTGFVKGVPHPEFEDLVGKYGSVVRVNDVAGMFTYWDTESRMIWQRPEHYAKEAATLVPSEFQRIYNNEWSSPLEAFVEETWWRKCINSDLPPLTDSSTPVVVGIDMAVSRDCAALVAVTRDPFDPKTKTAVRAVKIFSPKDLGGVIDQEKMIRPLIEEWASRWNVVCWVYDPKEMAKLAQDMTREGIGWFKAFGQTTPRAVSDKELHDMILAQQISWNPNTTEGDIGYYGDGSDKQTLYKHIVRAGASTQADAYRIQKLSDSAKVDGAVALSQAAYTALQLSLTNKELNPKNILELLRTNQITTDEFSEKVRKLHPELLERLNDY